jgi:hypothetical protein
MIQETALAQPERADEVSLPFVGRWSRLVSTTNWEKGRIICAWRKALEDEGRPPAESTDEAWACLVGHVSSQHVGRLRRVYHRFGPVESTYPGLYWSHFLAALDWADAEMWLEGAVRSGWSVSSMREERGRVLGAVEQPDAALREVDAEWDDEASPADSASPANAPGSLSAIETVVDHPEPAAGSGADVEDPEDHLDSAGDPHPREEARRADSASSDFRALEALGRLPEDLRDAIEDLKLAILRYKLDGWRQVNKTDVVACLEGLVAIANRNGSEEG